MAYKLSLEIPKQREVMSKISVELVKYDTEKTFKRKRKNLLVDSQTEQAVIDKLEQIHKGDQVKVIHEIVWGEAPKSKIPDGDTYGGYVKFFDEEKGFGFIQPEEDIEDLFFHSSALGGNVLFKDDFVEFQISDGPKGPIAIKIKRVIREE